MEKMWAGRFEKALDKQADDFNSSIHFDCRMYKQDITGSMVHAMMLSNQGIITKDEYKEILNGLSGILEDIDNGKLAIDMDAEDIHMFIESELTKRIGNTGKKLHTARSRNDQVALDIRLYLANECEEIGKLLLDLIAVIKEKANEMSIARYQEELVEYQAKEVDCKEEVEELRLQEVSFKQKREFVQENIRRIEEELKRLSQEEEALDETIASSKEDAQSREEGITALEEKISELKESAQTTEAEKENLMGRKEELLTKNKDFFEKREQLSERINALDKELYRLDAQKEKLEETGDHLVQYMWEQYELSHHEAIPLRDEQFGDRQELKRSIAKIKEEIKQLGNVNVNAIEDYKEVSERFEFMDKQRNDLVEAENMLKNIIAELDEGMKKQFTEMFTKIQVEFDKAFKELFGGGKGTLELIEPENILETGVRIISQPPGKKLQNMMQLSGGEKALTAIALLFAIQNLKPSPFCLLDEIEAALDDSNVGRFANYLHKLTKNTQFIVITHRRGTMAAADRLYGITMQEKGVSTLVSVNLLQDDLGE